MARKRKHLWKGVHLEACMYRRVSKNGMSIGGLCTLYIPSGFSVDSL